MMREGIFGCDGLSPEVVYRICAIRETFEETGILIARSDLSNTEYEANIEYKYIITF